MQAGAAEGEGDASLHRMPGQAGRAERAGDSQALGTPPAPCQRGTGGNGE